MNQKSAITPIEIPQFLIKSTLGCAIVVVLALSPFFIINLVQANYLLALALLITIIACSINVWHGLHGKYNLALNTYFISPIGAATIIYAFFLLGINATYWAFMLTFSYYFVLPQNRATFFNIITLLILTSSVWYLFDPALAARFSAAIIGTNLFAFLSMRQVYQLNNLLRDQATKDPLTGLLNRSTLDNTLELAISQHKRTNMPMSILFFDIDHFKNINDSLGHAVGDKVLIDLANIVSERIRETDSIFRTGGEEFLILAYNTNQQQATDIAESLRKKIELSLITDNKTITASFGVTELQQDMTVISWMKACDEKLYLAKKRGRNNVVS